MPTPGVPHWERPARKGRASIFRDKILTSETRVYGYLSQEGAAAFQEARARLRSLYREITGHQPSSVSDGDTVEFLCRGVEETSRYLRSIHGET